MTSLRELHSLGDGRVGGNAAHVKELIRAEPKEVVHVGIQPAESTAHARVEQTVEPCATPQHAVRQLAREPPIARIQPRCLPVEGPVEQLTTSQVRTDFRRDVSRLGHCARPSRGACRAAVFAHRAKILRFGFTRTAGPPRSLVRAAIPRQTCAVFRPAELEADGPRRSHR